MVVNSQFHKLYRKAVRAGSKKNMALFGAIPEDRGNPVESNTIELPMRNKQRRKHHKKEQTMANRMMVCFIIFTKMRPRYGHGNFATGIGFRILVVKFQWPYRGCYFVKTTRHTVIRFDVV